MDQALLDVLAGQRCLTRQGYELRILSAWELIQARQEARSLEGPEETLALRGNACILSRAVYRGGMRLFSSGRSVLEGWSGEKIAQEMEAYRALADRVDPDCGQETRISALMEALEKEPMERIRWYVLKTFGVLPTESRARSMTEGDYLYCAVQLMLDNEEQKNKLCPTCRQKVEEHRCIRCGGAIEDEADRNPSFDLSRFEEMRQGG